LALSDEAPDLKEKCADHLYQAFMAHADISKENLLWLGDWYFSKNNEIALQTFSEILKSGFDETVCYKLGKLYSLSGRTEDQISILEKLMEHYNADPTVEWKWKLEAKLLLAQAYIEKGWEEKALGLLNEVANGHSATRSETIAQAYLDKARIFRERLQKNPDNPALVDVASQFKDLVLQRRLEQEPIHLEAALDYVSLLEKIAPNPMEKRQALLEKVIKDFENTDNVLSKDYHQARLKYPAKNRIFENYMRFIDVEILIAKSELSTDIGLQKELQAKAKDLLLQIKSECDQPTLLKRISSRLQNADVSASK
jgi:tetratricopeptide (TPR) repeat protein